MKQVVEIYDHDEMDMCCESDRDSRERNLQDVIFENPFLTGQEAIELFELENKLKALKSKNDLQQKLFELSQNKDKWFKYNHERTSNECYCRISAYVIEWNNLYVIMDSYITSPNGITFKEEQKYEIEKFKSLEPKAINSQKYYGIRDKFNDITGRNSNDFASQRFWNKSN